ncbi:MAG TPA: GNAT family N-acetyltransferase [Euzebyales bacterium]|nr:GNAT family N-acetyltransferase [Euzebyales bacterium]
MHLRTAHPHDADALADLHVRAWQRAYRGLMPAAFLDGLSVTDRIDLWHEVLDDPPRRSAQLLLEDLGRAVGFVLVGGEELKADAARGEVYALYVDPDHWRRGVGSALLAAGCDRLRAVGFGDAVLWVHEGNERARVFYTARGWAADGTRRRQTVLGIEAPEVRYRRVLPGRGAPCDRDTEGYSDFAQRRTLTF